MKKIALISCLLGLSSMVWGKNGYEVKVKFKQPVADQYVTLAHYYVKPFPKVYKTDSAQVINNEVIFKSKDSLLGGIYMVLFNNNSNFAEMLLDNGDQFEMIVDTANQPHNIKFNNSKANQDFYRYQIAMGDSRKNAQPLYESLSKAKNKKDSAAIQTKIDAITEKFQQERTAIATAHKGKLLGNIINAFTLPEVPKGVKYIPGTKEVDSMYDFYYFRDNYWKSYDFSDNRLVNTPILDSKLEHYFKYVMQIPDSVNAAADMLLTNARSSSEQFKYMLHWLTNYTYTSNVMGLDQSFVHLVSNYHMKGDATWLDSTQLKNYVDRAKAIAPTMLGAKGADLKLVDAYNPSKSSNLYDFKAKYTILVFWDPDCGSCQKEVPALDSVYKANNLAKYDAQFYSVPLHTSLETIHNKIDKMGVKHWKHNIDVVGNNNIKENYDAIATPKIYILDEDKKFIGKGINHESLGGFFEFYEKQKKAKK